ncbi:hypothetical protein TRFO_33947 [Tritrichomonas foetus]|uniref:Initiator binding domain-containing protein n=1 Tax=Tritrichomonas foetus TaxID=1144522 RepID=A0A1J4JKA7_9EUKA|nr:hypothetical protein TRFO_33947 [Tritrichomonas foetus]|eukprot:OHS99576.1 hypothetical protein TRFO_33947 [Tritrichomonas foetus]
METIYKLFEKDWWSLHHEVEMSNIVGDEHVEPQNPQYWDILSDEDKKGYVILKNEINQINLKRSQKQQVESFQRTLNIIQRYAERKDDNDWKRFLVCGICWMDGAIAVNIRQLKILVSKCKSSINGSLQKLGFLPAQSHIDLKLVLYPLLPLIKNDYNELRQWTVRYKGNIETNTLQFPKISNVPLPIQSSIQSAIPAGIPPAIPPPIPSPVILTPITMVACTPGTKHPIPLIKSEPKIVEESKPIVYPFKFRKCQNEKK